MFLPFVPLKVRFVPHPVDTGNSIGYYLPEELREIRKKRRVNNENEKICGCASCNRVALRRRAECCVCAER